MTFMLFGLVYSAGSILIDYVELSKYCLQRVCGTAVLPNKQSFVGHLYKGQRFSHHMLVLAYLILCMYIIMDYSHPGNLVVMLAFTIFATESFQSVYMFLSFLPTLGPYVILMLRMFSDMMLFIILFIVTYVPYVLFMLVYMNVNATESCIEEFKDINSAAYNTLLMMVNMIDLRDFKLGNPTILHFVHGTFIFGIAILMINFLIAVTTNTAGNLLAHHSTLATINLLYSATNLEYRLGPFMPWYYRHMKSKYMCVRDNKYLIVDVTATKGRKDSVY